MSDSFGPTTGQALLLGLIQGPAELLPVSSSGHLALLRWLAGWGDSELDPELGKSFEIALHAGTAAALPIVMHQELNGALRRLRIRGSASVALSMLVPALVGYTLEQPIERRLSAPGAVATGLLVGALAMAVVDRQAPTRRIEEVTDRDGIALGVAQAIALAPGISRNGATLVCARVSGFDRRDSDALSWLAALPVIFGAGALKGGRLVRRGLPSGAGRTLAVGMTASFCSTLAAGKLLRANGRSPGSLLPYALYRGALGALVVRRLSRIAASSDAHAAGRSAGGRGES